MKKLLFIIIFFLSLLPYSKDGELRFIGLESVFSQGPNLSPDQVLRNYLNQNNTDPNLNYYIPNGATGYVAQSNLTTGTIIQFIYTQYYTSTHEEYKAYLESLPSNPDPLAPPTPAPVVDLYEKKRMEIWLQMELELLRMEERANDYAEEAREMWSQFGNTNEGYTYPPREECIEEAENIDAFEERTDDFNNVVAGQTLPCTTRFLLSDGKTIQFNSSQLSRIASYKFNGSTLVAVVDIYGVTYSKAKRLSVHRPWSRCPEDYQIIDGVKYIVAEYQSYCFVAFDRLREGNSGAVYDENLKIWTYFPYNNIDYCFDVSATVVQAQAGDVVYGCSNNGLLYCETLTAEDCQLTTIVTRDKDMKIESINLEHYVNVPRWVEEFFYKFQIFPDDCTIAYVNAKLAELHADPIYTSVTDENLKKVMEYQSVAYNYLFGTLYCKTDPAAASGKNDITQFGLGLLHEAIGSIDVKAIVQGIAQISKGLLSIVPTQIQHMIDGAKDAIVQHTTLGTINYEKIALDFIKANNSDLLDAYDQAKSIAVTFKDVYFSKCDSDAQYGNICPYRYGEITMMVLPIVLTAGEWAVVKAESLIAKYVAKTEDAIQLMKIASNTSQTTIQQIYSVVDDAEVASNLEKVVIKEADGTVASTIKQEGTPGDEIVVITRANLYVNTQQLASLTAELPSPGGFVGKVKLRQSAHKIDATVDGTLKVYADDIIANGDNLGTKTELIQDHIFQTELGLTKLNGHYGSNNGYDGLYIEGTIANPTKIYIVESKQYASGGVQLAPGNLGTGLKMQMSDNWVSDVANSIAGDGRPDIAAMIINNPTLIQKYVLTLNRSTADINILKLGIY